MPEIIRTRCLLSLTLRLFEDGNVEVESRKSDKKNALGRQNYLLTERERFALLSLIHDELEKYAIEDQILDSHNATNGGSMHEPLTVAQNEAMLPPAQYPNALLEAPCSQSHHQQLDASPSSKPHLTFRD